MQSLLLSVFLLRLPRRVNRLLCLRCLLCLLRLLCLFLSLLWLLRLLPVVRTLLKLLLPFKSLLPRFLPILFFVLVQYFLYPSALPHSLTPNLIRELHTHQCLSSRLLSTVDTGHSHSLAVLQTTPYATQGTTTL